MAVVPGYRLGEALYTGRCSQVFRAERVEGGGPPVIIKLLNREFPAVEESDRLRREFHLLRKVGADGVAEVYDLVKCGTTFALVLEDFGGESLLRLDVAGKLSLADFLGLAIQVAHALHAVHAKWTMVDGRWSKSQPESDRGQRHQLQGSSVSCHASTSPWPSVMVPWSRPVQYATEKHDMGHWVRAFRSP